MIWKKLFCIQILVIYLKAGVLESKPLACYHTNWSQYRPGLGQFFPKNIDPFLCTHIIYAFAKIETDRLEPFEWNDLSTDWSKGMYENTIDLKKINKDLKILIAVGGWNAGSGPFSNMVRNEAYRKNFVKTSVDFLLKNKFDGLDIDWEYPGSREGSHPEDKPLFTTLLRELREAFTPHNLLLTAAVGVGESTAENGYEIDKITHYLDFINLMTYDLHGAWDPFLGHHAALHARKDENEFQSKLNVEWVVDYWLSKGAEPNKILLGLGLYGRSFTLSQPGQNKLGDPAKGPSTAGTYTRTEGIFSYYEVCEKLKSPGWTLAFSDEQKVSYCYSNSEWIGFDNKKSLQKKMQLLHQKGLGGAMLWALDFDDFNGHFCNEGKFPLVNFIKSELNGGSIEPPPPHVTDSTSSSVIETTTEKPAVVTPESTKDPENYCQGNGYFVKPNTKCKEFFLCLFYGTPNANIFFFKCSDNLIFDVENKGCNYETVAVCNENSPEQPLQPSTAIIDTVTDSVVPKNTTKIDHEDQNETGNENNEKKCSKNGYFIKHGTDCKEYYFCAFVGTKFERIYNYKCDNGRKFDLSTRKCDYVDCKI